MRNCMKYIHFFVFLSVFFIVSSVNAKQKSFVIGVENITYYPYYSHNDKDVYIGASRDLLDAFAKSKNYRFTYRILPLERLFSYLMQKKEIDFKFPDHGTWQAEFKEGCGRPVHYSNPVFSYTDGLVVETLVFNPNLPHTNGSYLLSTTRHQNIIEEFNSFLKDNPKTRDKIINKYKLTR